MRFPELDSTFCLSRFGWNSRRTDETLQPVIKQLNTQQVAETAKRKSAKCKVKPLHFCKIVR